MEVQVNEMDEEMERLQQVIGERERKIEEMER